MIRFSAQLEIQFEAFICAAILKHNTVQGGNVNGIERDIDG